MKKVYFLLLICSAIVITFGNADANTNSRKLPTNNQSFSTSNIKNCNCEKSYEPVCGQDEITYSNECEMECKNVKKSCNGICPCQDISSIIKDNEHAPCLCTAQLSPVCGKNGITFGNACAAECANVPIDCHKACPCQTTVNPDDSFIACAAVVCESIENYVNPCETAKCRLFPFATCRVRCCEAVFYFNGEEVSCGDDEFPKFNEKCIKEDQECEPIPNGVSPNWFISVGEACCPGLQCCQECVPVVYETTPYLCQSDCNCLLRG